VSVFGDGAEGFAADGGGVQLQRIRSGCAAQDVTAAAQALRLQAAALEEDLQGLLRGVITAQTGAAFVCRQIIVPGDKHAALLGEMVEHCDQRAGRHCVMLLLHICQRHRHAQPRHGRCHGQSKTTAGEGGAQHGISGGNQRNEGC
jgi:hypothetical protein